MELIDLTKEIAEGMDIYPGDPEVEIKQWATINKEGYSVHKLCMGSHTGTHLDAPRHMIPNGKTLSEINLEALTGQVVKIKCEHKHVKLNDVIAQIQKRENTAILVFDIPKDGFLDIEVAQYIVKTNKIKAVCFIDGASIDNPDARGFPVHKTFLNADIPIITGMVNTDKLKDNDFIIILPLKAKILDGAPCRAVAIRGFFF